MSFKRLESIFFYLWKVYSNYALQVVLKTVAERFLPQIKINLQPVRNNITAGK